MNSQDFASEHALTLIAGLGNPGPQYADTRHNVGFWVLDELAARHGGSFKHLWWRPYDECRVMLARRTAVLAKPRTFMNASGRAVGSLTRRFGLAPGRLVVVLDDVELPLGRVRIRKGGRDGGHRGLRSIIATVGSEDIPRIRVGVGACPPGQSLADFVLSAFDDDDRDAVHGLVVRAADAVECLLADGADQAMNRFN